MDKDAWEKALTELTSGVGALQPVETFSFGNHLGIALKFFQDQNIDMAGKNLLDVGCFDDGIKRFLSSTWQGFDIAPHAKCNSTIMVGDIHSTNFEEKTFDIIFCSHALEHLLSPIMALNEMKRILKDDGSMIIAVPLYPGFISDEHNYVMPHGSWLHLFNRLKLQLVSDSQEKDCGMYHLRKTQ